MYSFRFPVFVDFCVGVGVGGCTRVTQINKKNESKKEREIEKSNETNVIFHDMKQ